MGEDVLQRLVVAPPPTLRDVARLPQRFRACRGACRNARHEPAAERGDSACREGKCAGASGQRHRGRVRIQNGSDAGCTDDDCGRNREILRRGVGPSAPRNGQQAHRYQRRGQANSGGGDQGRQLGCCDEQAREEGRCGNTDARAVRSRIPSERVAGRQDSALRDDESQRGSCRRRQCDRDAAFREECPGCNRSPQERGGQLESARRGR